MQNCFCVHYSRGLAGGASSSLQNETASDQEESATKDSKGQYT